MAFYQNAPKQKRPPRRPREDSWEEEGTRYNRGRKPARKPEDRPEPRFGPGSRRPGQNDRPGADPRRSYRGEEKLSDRFGPAPRGRSGKDMPAGGRREAPRAQREYRGERFDRRPERPAFEREEQKPPRRSYQDFEHSREPIYEDAQAEPNENILSGRNPIREALKSGRDIEKLLVMKGELSGSARQLVQMAKEAHIPVQEVDKSRLDAIAPNHQGMIAFASAYAYSTVEDMLALAREKNEAPYLVILDGVTDPHNLGAIIRTAECVGAHGVIVRERRGVGLTPAAVKASAGAVEHVKVARVTNLNRVIDDLKRQGIWIYGLAMDGDDYESVDFTGGAALVVGSEGSGISRLTEEICDRRVSLPMKGQLDSLNASVAAGIVMYRVLSSRKS